MRHGVYISEAPTPILPPVQVDSAMPVAFITAPVHLASNPYAVTNQPKLCFTNNEAVATFGFSRRPEIWNNYTACEMIFSQFSLYGVAPIVLVNVLDPAIHNDIITNKKQNLDGYSLVLSTEYDTDAYIPVEGILLDTITVTSYEGNVYEQGTHYTLSFNNNGHVVVTAMEGVTDGISENEQLEFNYTKLAPEKVDSWDIIGGYDIETDRNLGLALVDDIFPLFRRVPGLLLTPQFSSDPVVAAIMETKAANINGHFRCPSLNDIPTMIADGNGNLAKHRYTDVPAWKNQNNYTSPAQFNGYPKVRLGELIFNFSTQMAGLIGRTDFENRGVPYNSPSNKNMRINGLCYENGDEVILNNPKANFLNGQGIVTAINFTNGWVGWGNRTGAYPMNTDVKDNMIPIRRMFMWIGNTIILTFWRKIDFPLTRRTIETIVDSINIWLTGLVAQEFILGGRVEFLTDDNPTTSIIDGAVKFRVSISPPPPLEEAEFILQYDPAYLANLFV